MVTDSLVSGVLPKSRAGRQATPIDDSLVKQLVEALKKNPTGKNDEGDERPIFYGPSTEFETQGKASSAGRRYAKMVAAQLEKIVRVNVSDNGKNGNAKRFSWRIYLPLSETQTEEAPAN